MFQVRLFKTLKEPYYTALQLRKAEDLTGFWMKLILLLLFSVLLAFVTSFLGVGNDILSAELNQRSPIEFETIKSLFAIGQIGWSLFEALFILFIPSLFFWALSDIEWKKFIVVQQGVLVILLIEKILLLPFAIFLGLSLDLSNPFSLGIIGQALTNQEYVLQILSQISIFKIWAIVLQYKYIKVLADHSAKRTALFVIGFNVVILLISAFFSIMDLETYV
ncbi:hypothetical protein [Niallia sp. Krafla_26]|uniref:hypothetical protein n=1 Tax=Niallia sp. Krafla_26 TaxID=3064703 RepID=UPI003D166A02